MKKNLKDKIDYCGLNYQTEMNKLIFGNIFLIIPIGLSYYFLKDIKISLICLLMPLIFSYVLLSSYSSKARKLDEEREDEFVTIISYFEIFITNKNNVYQSFNKVIQYAGEWMKDCISNLLKEIDADKSVQPYVNFANNFRMKIATNIMLSIYSMVDQGESFEQINQFQVIFEQLSKSKQLEKIAKKERSLSILASLPLVGAAGTTIVLTISVISIIGDLINVI